MPASAPNTSTGRHRQSVAEYHRIGMRLPGLLGPRPPAIFTAILLYSLIRSTHANSPYQNFLVCIEPKLQRCITWLTNVEEALEIAKNLYLNRDITRHCGVSDLVPIPPRRKLITIVQNVDDSQKRLIFCKVRTIIIKGAVDQIWGTNKLKELYRTRRQTSFAPRGRYRGQTQSQYLAIEHGAGKDDGIAEAHSAADSSRASVSGSSGMGQAQSQTMYDPSCDDCVGRKDLAAENLKRGPFTGTQGVTPGGTSVQGMLPGDIGPSSQNKPGSFGFNPNGPNGYGSSQTNSPSNLGGQNQFGTPGSNGAYNPNQQGISPGGSLSSPNNGGAPGRNSYFPGQVGSENTGPSDNGGYNPGGSNGPGMFNNNFIPGKPSGGSYGPNQNVIPGSAGMFSPSQQGIPNGNFIPGTSRKPGDLGSGTYVPNQLVGNGVYSSGQPSVPGGGGNYGNNLDGRPATSPSAIPGQIALPSSNGNYRQGSYSPPSGVSPGGITSNIYNPQGVIPSQNGGSGPIQGDPRVLGKNQYTSGFPGGSAGYNGGTKWPVNTGSFQGPDGTTYYCCVAGPNNSPQYYKSQSNGGRPDSLPFQGGLEGSSGPNNLMAPPGLYNSGSKGLPAPGTQFITGTGGGPNERLIPGMAGQPGSIGLDGLYTPGTTIDQNRLQGPVSLGGQSGSLAPGNQYSTGNIQNGIPIPGVQYGLGGSAGSTGMQTPGGQYSPIPSGGQSGLQKPNGLPALGTQFHPGTMGQTGVQGPFLQYGSGVPNGQNGLYNPNGQYSPGISGRQTGLPVNGGQYGPGSITGQSGQPSASGQYGPGGTVDQTGLPGVGGQYIPGTTMIQSGLPNTNGQYGPGGIGSPNGHNGLQNQGGQYSPNNVGATYVPGGVAGQGGQQGLPGQYGPGGTGQNALQIPGGIGGQSGERGPTGQYSPTGINGQTGLQLPGSITGQGGPQTPTGQYSPQSSSTITGLPSPNGQYSGPGGQNGGQNPSGQYGPGGIVGQNGLQIPGSQYGPPGVGGRYGPGSTIDQSILQNQGSHPAGTGGVGNYGTGISGNNPYGYDTQGTQTSDGNYNGAPQNVVDPNSAANDGDDSEAEASVTQGGNGTVATASSKGGNDKGRAQTHVHGAYRGSGSFSAQAEISGENKAANSEVTGDKKGASSQAQGTGRNNKSQANVQLGSETGSVLTGSQSEGVMHSSNTQVQGSVKGGMADAQARGPGSTSSQAQIGFTPYKEGDQINEQQTVPFVGGGTASAQSSGRTGSSQSQLRGSFKYGITYNGAAQAGASIDKDAVFPNRLPFDKIDVYDESNKNINVNLETTLKTVDDAPTEEAVTDKLPVPSDITEVMTTSVAPLPNFEAKLGPDEVEEEIGHNPEDEYGSHTHSDHHKDTLVPTPVHPSTVEGRRSFQPNYNNNADYDYGTEKEEHAPEDYDVDSYSPEGEEPSEVDQYNEFSKDTETHQSLQSPKRKGLEVRQATGGNTQHIVLGSLNDQDAEITQRNSERPDEYKVYQPGERVPGTGGYTIPIGFTGSVKSVASKENTYVVGTKDSPSQAQTVSLTPGSGKVKYTYPTAHTRNINPKDLRSLYNPKADDNRYISVSKSVTRALDDDNNVRKQYSHTYYTKSSSCGYFTFTCTMVSSSEGRKKVCKPKLPTNPDGTPMRC